MTVPAGIERAPVCADLAKLWVIENDVWQLFTACVTYCPAEPFTVRLGFGLESEVFPDFMLNVFMGRGPLGEHVFDRSILSSLHTSSAKSGELYLSLSERQLMLRFVLEQPQGSTFFEVSADVVAEFLARTLELVPSGTEQAWLGLDVLMARLTDNPSN